MRLFGIAAALVLLLFAVLTTAASCGGSPDSGDVQRRESTNMRHRIFAKASVAIPAYETHNWPARDVLNEYTKRHDRLNHPYYIYILSPMTGQIIQYIVSSTLPVNECAFLSSTQDVDDRPDGDLILTAPSLDGVFYGGAGASASCDAEIIIDQESGAMLTVAGGMMITLDAPLELDLEPLKIDLTVASGDDTLLMPGDEGFGGANPNLPVTEEPE